MRFQEITMQQLKVLQNTNVKYEARRNGNTIIIRFPISEQSKIDAVLKQQKTQQIR